MNDEWHSYKEFNVDKHLWDIRSVISSNYWYDWDITDTWRLAKNQYYYFADPENGFINGSTIKITDIADIADVVKNYNIQQGDLLYWSSADADDIYHATIISKVDDEMIYYAGNTQRQFDQSLADSLGNSTVYIIRINNYIEGE